MTFFIFFSVVFFNSYSICIFSTSNVGAGCSLFALPVHFTLSLLSYVCTALNEYVPSSLGLATRSGNSINSLGPMPLSFAFQVIFVILPFCLYLNYIYTLLRVEYLTLVLLLEYLIRLFSMIFCSTGTRTSTFHKIQVQLLLDLSSHVHQHI